MVYSFFTGFCTTVKVSCSIKKVSESLKRMFRKQQSRAVERSFLGYRLNHIENPATVETHESRSLMQMAAGAVPMANG